MMRIGTIGAGEVAPAVAREALARGHEIVLSGRSGPGALADKVSELGRGASAATVEEAASLDYVLLAVPWKNVEAALRGLPEWKRSCPHRRYQPIHRDQPQTRSRRPRRHWRHLGLKRLAAILVDLAEVDAETPTGTRRRLGPRPEGSGSKHDSDVYGGQQYAPLLGLEVAG